MRSYSERSAPISIEPVFSSGFKETIWEDLVSGTDHQLQMLFQF